MKLPEGYQLLRDIGKEELAKNLFIKTLLWVAFENNNVCSEDSKLDLNPHLIIKYVCEQVAEQVRNEDFTCTTEDVMLVWLTDAVYLGQYLCSVT